MSLRKNIFFVSRHEIISGLPNLYCYREIALVSQTIQSHVRCYWSPLNFRRDVLRFSLYQNSFHVNATRVVTTIQWKVTPVSVRCGFTCGRLRSQIRKDKGLAREESTRLWRISFMMWCVIPIKLTQTITLIRLLWHIIAFLKNYIYHRNTLDIFS